MINWKNKADDFFKDKFTSIARNSIFDSIDKFLSNEKSDRKQTFLLDIVLLMDWISQSEICTYLHQHTYMNLHTGVFVLKYKENNMSSSNQIITMLCNNNYLFSDSIIDINNTEQLENLRGRTVDLIIMDDFSGTGSTLWKAIKKISKYCNLKLKIIIYAWTEQAIEYLNKKCSECCEVISFIIIKPKDSTRRYNEKLSGELLDYFESISTKIHDTTSRYGFGNSGTMISLDGISPNNNIPIIWKSDLTIDEKDWIPLLNRDFKTEAINKFKDIVYNKYKKNFYDIYKKNSAKISNMKDFQIMFILYSFKYSTYEFLNINFGYDTKEECQTVLRGLEEKGLINQIDGVYEVLDESILKAIIEIDQIISKDILNLIRDDAKNVTNEFVGKRNYEYNRR